MPGTVKASLPGILRIDNRTASGLLRIPLRDRSRRGRYGCFHLRFHLRLTRRTADGSIKCRVALRVPLFVKPAVQDSRRSPVPVRSWNNIAPRSRTRRFFRFLKDIGAAAALLGTVGLVYLLDPARLPAPDVAADPRPVPAHETPAAPIDVAHSPPAVPALRDTAVEETGAAAVRDPVVVSAQRKPAGDHSRPDPSDDDLHPPTPEPTERATAASRVELAGVPGPDEPSADESSPDGPSPDGPSTVEARADKLPPGRPAIAERPTITPPAAATSDAAAPEPEKQVASRAASAAPAAPPPAAGLPAAGPAAARTNSRNPVTGSDDLAATRPPAAPPVTVAALPAGSEDRPPAKRRTGPPTLGDRVVTFLESKLGERVGGGECAHAASEALRVAGAEFVLQFLGEDTPEPGDYVWGKLIKILEGTESGLSDSAPDAEVLPGDILQYHNARVGNGGGIATFVHHTAIVAAAEENVPTETYDENIRAGGDPEHNRTLVRQKMDLRRIQSGWVRVYRPIPRVNKPGLVKFAIVNNTAGQVQAALKLGDATIGRISLDVANTTRSYLTWTFSSSSGQRPSLSIAGGADLRLENGAAYELYSDAAEEVSIRRLEP